MKVSVFRKEHFNAAHRLFVPSWTMEQNEANFGKCNNVNFHGHNYEVIVKITGEIDPITGYVIDLKILSDIIRDNVLICYDHKNLNLDLEDFKFLNPTAENICVTIWKRLRAKLEEKFDLKVTLFETERNFVEYPSS